MTKRTIFLAATAAALSLMVAGSSSANHALVAAHRPPPAAVSGTDVDLAIEVASTCTIVCSPVEVTLSYVDGEGWDHEMTQYTRQGMPAGVLVFTIPAEHVSGEALSYSFTAQQTQCGIDMECHTHQASAPARGAHYVPIITVFEGYQPLP